MFKKILQLRLILTKSSNHLKSLICSIAQDDSEMKNHFMDGSYLGDVTILMFMQLLFILQFAC